MMTSYFPATFLGAGALEFALLFFVGGIVILLRSLHTQDQQITEQKRAIAQLGEQLESCAAQLVEHQGHISGLHEQSVSLNARQQLVEKHGSDVQRIDLAMRMLKRGVGNAETLHDLGLSSNEIKLLLRLHSRPKGEVASTKRHEGVIRQTDKPQASRPQAVPETVDRIIVEEADAGVSAQVSEQGQALAKLFETRVAS